MDTILTIISMGLVITALVLCICTWRALRPVSKHQPRAGYKHSALERRRKSLELATKEWNRKLSRGHIFLAGEQKHLVDQLEREVAALEKELFEPKKEESATPKLKTTRSKPVIQVEFVDDDSSPECYIITCSCGWSWRGRSVKQAEAKCAEHERTHG